MGFLVLAAHGQGAASPLLARGHTVVPEPQKVTLEAGDFPVGPDWRLDVGPGVKAGDVAVQSLREDLDSRFHLKLGAQGKGSTIRLQIEPNSVTIGQALDRNKQALAEQAYRLELDPGAIRVTANAAAGLFYGVETLIQLLKRQDGKLWLPKGQIVDWPDLELRSIYWDDAHHLSRPEYLKRALRQAAFYKVNGFIIKLEGHFQFKSAPALVEPYALTPAELQELTDYGLRYHVQLIPYLDGPAHIAFILKHPEYAKLREYPQSNYELCVTNADSYQLLQGMFQDLLEANKGVKYFYLSTDEPYYVGMADNSQCQEARRAKELGSRGKLLAEFVTKTANYLHDRGRTVLFWGETPLRPDDIPALPSHMVSGETYQPPYDRAFKAHGIREMVYVSTEGEEKMFPDYFVLPGTRRVHPGSSGPPRVAEAFTKISTDPGRTYGELIGAVVAGWADMGLHEETFWLGYATIPAAAWHPGTPPPGELMGAFYPTFYGPSVTNMDRTYQLMSLQAQFWSDSWDTVPSKSEKGIFGYSAGVFETPRPRHDQSIPLPAIPSGKDLSYNSTWASGNAKRMALTPGFLTENDELMGLLNENLRRAQFNRYNLEVFRSIARLYRQNLEMLAGLGRIDKLLTSAQAAAKERKPQQAVASVDQALSLARRIRAERNAVLDDATNVWYKTWYPRAAEANGRRFLHELDDVKDHLPDRTVDMSFLVYRELLLPFGEWFDKVETARNEYARANGLPAAHEKLEWKSTARER